MAYIPSSKEEEGFLKNFDPSQYKNPAVAADTALFTDGGENIKILLIKRGGYPYKGCWALPGGFVNIDEDIKDAAARELFEETGISGLYMEQAFVWGKPERDPRQRVITVSYIAFARYQEAHAKAGDDASQAEWFSIKDYKLSDKDGITEISCALCGPETLRPSVRFPSGQIQRIERAQSGGLAFDHAESVMFSFELFKKRVREGFPGLEQKDAAARNSVIKAILKGDVK